MGVNTKDTQLLIQESGMTHISYFSEFYPESETANNEKNTLNAKMLSGNTLTKKS